MASYLLLQRNHTTLSRLSPVPLLRLSLTHLLQLGLAALSWLTLATALGFGFTPKALASDSITLLTEENKTVLSTLSSAPSTVRVVALQLPPEKLTREEAEQLVRWVNQGGVVWIYDSRLALLFGFQEDPLKGGEVQGARKTTPYGTNKEKMGMAWYARTAHQSAASSGGRSPSQPSHSFSPPQPSHPIATGVDQVAVFVMETEKGRYSAVKEGEGVIPLLRIGGSKKLIAAIRALGKGFALFKPLVYEKGMDGKIFNRNVELFSLGKPIPGSGSDPPSSWKKKHDKVTLSNGTVVYGTIFAGIVTLIQDGKTPTYLARSKIVSLSFSPEGDRIILKDGKILQGTLDLNEIKIQDYAKATQVFPRSAVQEIFFSQE